MHPAPPPADNGSWSLSVVYFIVSLTGAATTCLDSLPSRIRRFTMNWTFCLDNTKVFTAVSVLLLHINSPFLSTVVCCSGPLRPHCTTSRLPLISVCNLQTVSSFHDYGSNSLLVSSPCWAQGSVMLTTPTFCSFQLIGSIIYNLSTQSRNKQICTNVSISSSPQIDLAHSLAVWPVSLVFHLTKWFPLTGCCHNYISLGYGLKLCTVDPDGQVSKSGL